MTSRLGLRARLTILVTVVFGTALSVTAIAALDAVEDRLVDDTRASAEAVLGNYLESINGGVATIGVVGRADSTRFFYLDGDGNEITEQQYFATIASGFDDTLADLVAVDQGSTLPGAGSSSVVVTSAVGAGELPGEVLDGTPIGSAGAIAIDPETGTVLAPDGEMVVFATGPVPEGEPHRVELGADVVAVAQTLTFADGETIQVGVSNPLQPITDSLDTIRQLLWFALPTLIAAIAFITWMAASRALHPVHAISSQAESITAANIHQRVPVPGANDEIHHLATTVNGMLQRLEDAQTRQHQLIADASHELRSPVAASRAQLDVATANPTATDWIATAEAVMTEQEHLSKLIDDLLTLSSLAEAEPDIAGDVDLDDLIAIEAARHQRVRTNIAEPVRVHGNPTLLTRLLRNLVDNATRHADHETLITLESHDTTAVIHVDDDGPGVPPERRDEIFERFVRLDEARDRHSGGTGLGLAIAREIARAHAGDIECTSSPLGGARFTLTIAQTPGHKPDSTRHA